MMKIIFILINIVTSQISFEQNSRSIQLSEFASNIVKKNCNACKAILIIHTNEEKSCDLFLMNNTGDTSKFILVVDGLGNDINQTVTRDVVNQPDLTIIFFNVDEYNDLESIIFAVELVPVWDIRGRFLVLLDGDKEIEDDWLKESFQSFWTRQILKVLITVVSEDKIVSYTYNPFFEDYKVQVSMNDLEMLWFNRKIKDMNGTPFKLYQLDTVLTDSAVKTILPDGKVTYVGEDGMYFSVFAEVLNAIIETHCISEDFSDNMIAASDPAIPFSKYVDLFSDLYDFDMLFNRAQIFHDNNLDHIYLYERNDVKIMLPRTGQIPKYLAMVLIVRVEVWAATLLSFIAVTIARWILGGKLYFLDNVTYLLGTAAPTRLAKAPEKLVLAIWMLGCLVITALFQTTLTSSLTVPKYYPDIDTLQDFAGVDLKVYATEFASIHIIRLLNNSQTRMLLNRFLVVPKNITTYSQTIDWINLYYEHYGVVVTQEQSYRYLLTNKSLMETHHIMSETLIPSATGFNMPKNKYYFEEVLQVFNTIQESGLHIYWRKYDYFLNKNISKHNMTQGSEKLDQNLTLVNLQSAFYLLMFGLFTAFVVFIMELFWFRGKK